jgi:hypothetical protein
MSDRKINICTIWAEGRKIHVETTFEKLIVQLYAYSNNKASMHLYALDGSLVSLLIQNIYAIKRGKK